MGYPTPESIVENFLKNDALVNPIERGKLFLRLNEDFEWSWSKISREIKKSPAYVINTIRLSKLPDAVKDGLISGLISEGHARALLGISEIRTIIGAYKDILRQKLSVRLTEQMVRNLKQNLAERESSEIGETDSYEREIEEKIKALSEEVTEALHGKGKISFASWLGGVRLEIVLDGRKEEIVKLLEQIKNILAKKSNQL